MFAQTESFDNLDFYGFNGSFMRQFVGGEISDTEFLKDAANLPDRC
jgi:hypothetical protein